MGRKSDTPKEERRAYLKTVGALAAGLAVGGAAAWLAKPAERVEIPGVTETVTQPGATVTVTQPGATVTQPGATVTVTGTAPPAEMTITPGKPYAGTTLDVAGYAGWICYAGAIEKLSEFEEATGIDVTVHEMPFPDILTKPLVDFSTGTKAYDLTMTSSGFFPSYYPYALPLNDLIERDLGSVGAYLNMNFPPVRDRAAPAGEVLSVPIHANIQFIMYRRDLIEDPAEKSAFQAEYGYELKQPRTHQQLVDIAEFFTRPEDDMVGFTYWGEGALGGLSYSQWLWCERRIPWITNDYIIDVEKGPGRETAIWLAKWTQDLTRVHGVTPDDPAAVSASVAWEMYKAGRTPMVFGWMGDYWGLANQPELTDMFGKPGSWTWVTPGGWWSCWALIADHNTDNPEGCWEFMKWNASVEVQAAMAAGSGQGSTFIEANRYQTEMGWTAPGVTGQLPVGTFPAFIPEWIDIESLIYAETPLLVAFEYTPEEYVDAMVAGIKDIIS